MRMNGVWQRSQSDACAAFGAAYAAVRGLVAHGERREGGPAWSPIPPRVHVSATLARGVHEAACRGSLSACITALVSSIAVPHCGRACRALARFLLVRSTSAPANPPKCLSSSPHLLSRWCVALVITGTVTCRCVCPCWPMQAPSMCSGHPVDCAARPSTARRAAAPDGAHRSCQQACRVVMAALDGPPGPRPWHRFGR